MPLGKRFAAAVRVKPSNFFCTAAILLLVCVLLFRPCSLPVDTTRWQVLSYAQQVSRAPPGLSRCLTPCARRGFSVLPASRRTAVLQPHAIPPTLLAHICLNRASAPSAQQNHTLLQLGQCCKVSQSLHFSLSYIIPHMSANTVFAPPSPLALKVVRENTFMLDRSLTPDRHYQHSPLELRSRTVRNRLIAPVRRVHNHSPAPHSSPTQTFRTHVRSRSRRRLRG